MADNIRWQGNSGAKLSFMTWKEFIYPSPKLQELYRLALCICGATILLGAWQDLNYHWGLLTVIPFLFIYQFGSYLTHSRLISKSKKQVLSIGMEFIDGVIAGALIALVGFDPIITLALGSTFLITIVGSMKPTAPLDIGGTFIGLLTGYWLLPITIDPGTAVQLMILLIAFAYCLLNTNMARHTHFLLADQHDSVLRQNDWLTLRTFHLSKYLSPALRKAILTGKDVKAGTQEKTLTVFFSDMEGFTKLAENLDPEQLTALLNTYLTEMSEIAFRFGGTVDKVIGDSIMVFFGDPESRGVRSDAISCVSMALSMKKAMTELQARWVIEGIANPPALRMGINSGVCKVGNFGTENRLDYTLLGRAVNLASRLESSAQSHEILVSRDTYDLIKDAVKCIDKGQILVKGFADPVNVFSVVDLHKNLASSQPKKHQALA
ncbi:MAG: adenylate/guanylate cyclase domain-containing protein [Porticoccaceae bacterium]|nr:adenylate/guanylate cyclase domain-containing protein [Porticoccaceae bacterium]